MAADPYTTKDKWLRSDERFRKKAELKVKPLNLSELIKKEALPDILAKDKEKIAKAAQEKADAALGKFLEAQNLLDMAQKSFDNAVEPKTNELLKLQEAQRVHQACDDAAKKLQKEADEAKKISDTASELLKKKNDNEKPKGKGPEPENLMMNFSVEMSKPKDGEFEFRVPLSDEALFLHLENMKKAFTKSAAGIAMISAGVLGNIDTLGLSHKLHWTWAYPAYAIGLPVHYFSDTVGNVFNKIAQNGPWGLSKLAVAGGLYYASSRLYWSTKFVWFNIGENRPAPGIDKKTIKEDLAKMALAVVTATASLYALNDFIHGNS